jgi:arginine decarboxylase
VATGGQGPDGPAGGAPSPPKATLPAPRPQAAAPLLEALLRYREDGVIRFHMPGHKGGAGAPAPALAAFGHDAFALDVTGVEGLDDPHQPRGVIAEAEMLAAQLYQADRSFFLVGGTSAGVQAMILAACRPGDTLIVARNVHKSIVAGMILGGVRPVYVPPEYDPEWGISLGVAPEAIRTALARHPEAAAVLVVSPTYHGVTSDLSAIAATTHAAGKPLLVDEAHGAHFPFHPLLPRPALRCGADACAQGMHKLAGAFTQASLLHVRGERVDPERVRAVLRLLQSTSASYLLLGSLDAARMQLATDGRRLMGRAIALAAFLRERVRRIPGLGCLDAGVLGRPGAHQLDPSKVTVGVRGLGLTGQEAELALRYGFGIQAEMSDLFNVLFLVGHGNRRRDVHALLGALRSIARDPSPYRRRRGETLLARAASLGASLAIPDPVLSPREAFWAPSRPVPLARAAGRVAAEIVTCYPPGVPLLCPGERVDAEVVEYLQVVREAGLRISGPADPTLETLRVVA